MNKRIMKKQSTPSKKMLKKLGKLEKGKRGKRIVPITRLELKAMLRYKARTGLRKRSYMLVTSSTGKLFLVRQEPRRRLAKAQDQTFGTHAIVYTVRV